MCHFHRMSVIENLFFYSFINRGRKSHNSSDNPPTSTEGLPSSHTSINLPTPMTTSTNRHQKPTSHPSTTLADLLNEIHTSITPQQPTTSQPQPSRTQQQTQHSSTTIHYNPTIYQQNANLSQRSTKYSQTASEYSPTTV